MVKKPGTLLQTVLLILSAGLASIGTVATAQEDNQPPATIPTALHAYDLLTVEDEINSSGQGGPKLSSDGTNVVYAVDREDDQGDLAGYVYRMPVPSGMPEEIAVVGSGPDITITPNGQTVLLRTYPNSSNALYVSDVIETEKIFEEESGSEFVDAVIDGSGEHVFLTISRPTHVVGQEGPVAAGLWRIDASGANLRPVVLLNDIRGLIGAADDDILYSADRLTLDVSDFTGELVYAVRNVTSGEWFVLAVPTNGGSPRLLHGPTGLVSRATISGDGSTVFILDIALEDTTRTPRFTVIGYGGANPHQLPAVVAGLSNNLNGLMLSIDGSWLLTSSVGSLMDTTDGLVHNLIPGCLNQIPGSLVKPTMNDTADQVVFLSRTSTGSTLVAIDIHDEVLPYAQVNNVVSIQPTELFSEDPDATVSVEVADIEPGSRACMILSRDLDRFINPVELRDDGTRGDETADDGVYTTGEINLPNDLTSGSVNVRIVVESTSADGTRQTDLYDIPDGLRVAP